MWDELRASTNFRVTGRPAGALRLADQGRRGTAAAPLGVEKSNSLTGTSRLASIEGVQS
jgi:hypothetical protein